MIARAARLLAIVNVFDNAIHATTADPLKNTNLHYSTHWISMLFSSKLPAIL